MNVVRDDQHVFGACFFLRDAHGIERTINEDQRDHEEKRSDTGLQYFVRHGHRDFRGQQAEQGGELDDRVHRHGRRVLEGIAHGVADDGRRVQLGAFLAEIDFDEPIGAEARTLSPSDFGFHNAIRRPDGMLDFVDFEYFGWDDPAKTIVDFLLHPGMQLDDALKRRFAAGVCAAFAELPALPARTRIVYPLFGLKWGLILLNDFLPERSGQAPGARPAAQLAKARSLVRRLAAEYADNPFLC